MALNKTSLQHPEIGSFALRMLWIPAVASVLVAGYLALHVHQNERASTMAVAVTNATPPFVGATSQGNVDAHPLANDRAVADEAILVHEALDPIGVGSP